MISHETRVRFLESVEPFDGLERLDLIAGIITSIFCDGGFDQAAFNQEVAAVYDDCRTFLVQQAERNPDRPVPLLAIISCFVSLLKAAATKALEEP